MEIICVANQKGGIGKTTTATTIASILSEKYGKDKVLFIDADPQGNSTDTFRAISKDEATLYDVILDREDPLPIAEAIQKTEIGHIVASDPALKKADIILANDAESFYLLKESLSELKEYDYVVIDTAPADNMLLKNCLVAANKVIVPITADRYAIQGLSDLNKTLISVKKYYNPNLEISGLLLVKYKKRQKLSQEVSETLEYISKQMNTKVFNTTIRECASTPQAQAARTTLMEYAPKCTTAIDYYTLVNEELFTKGAK